MANSCMIPRLPHGFVVYTADDLRVRSQLLDRIRNVYELYGFEALETPMIEYTEVLGQFLPDQDRPNGGVFSFQEEDGRWLSLRYDLTAPLARYVAAHFDTLPKPYRGYRFGCVFRNEKPGPGRFRQFMQFDADTIGAAGIAADAEICMMAADCMESLGLHHGDYVIRVNHRKLLDGVMEIIGLGGAGKSARRLSVLRAIDKMDRLGPEAVHLLLGPGRQDESGDFMVGAALDAEQITHIFSLVDLRSEDHEALFAQLKVILDGSGTGLQGVFELEALISLVRAAGFAQNRIRVDPSIVRGLEYYTGPVYEVELLLEMVNNKGRTVCFGSVGGGGRYDGMVGRFRPEDVPAVGFSVGVSRLQAALTGSGLLKSSFLSGPVVVLMMEADRLSDYQRMVRDLRIAGISSELYLGAGGMRAQMKYADRRRAPLVIIRGDTERDRGEVLIKDLVEGARLSQTVTDNKTWREARPAQVSVPEERLVEEVRHRLLVNPI
ncbi:MAG: histidine--tRNA ligase [Alphaproteobacteria bacterium]|nr:histidine--tRNA ligase [Alphaproteobacteria bacterium]